MSDKEEINIEEEKEMTTPEWSPMDVADGMIFHLTEMFENTKFDYQFLDSTMHIIIAITAIKENGFEEYAKEFDDKHKDFSGDRTIIFRQIIDTNFDLADNMDRVQGSYERNLRVHEKLQKSQLEKYGQLIMCMDQAEVTSIKTVKTIVKEDEK